MQKHSYQLPPCRYKHAKTFSYALLLVDNLKYPTLYFIVYQCSNTGELEKYSLNLRCVAGLTIAGKSS